MSWFSTLTLDLFVWRPSTSPEQREVINDSFQTAGFTESSEYAVDLSVDCRTVLVFSVASELNVSVCN